MYCISQCSIVTATEHGSFEYSLAVLLEVRLRCAKQHEVSVLHKLCLHSQQICVGVSVPRPFKMTHTATYSRFPTPDGRCCLLAVPAKYFASAHPCLRGTFTCQVEYSPHAPPQVHERTRKVPTKDITPQVPTYTSKQLAAAIELFFFSFHRKSSTSASIPFGIGAILLNGVVN